MDKQLTFMEYHVLRVIIENEYQDGEERDDVINHPIWYLQWDIDCNPEIIPVAKQLGGLVSSLVKKGYVGFHKEANKKDSTCWITAEGWNAQERYGAVNQSENKILHSICQKAHQLKTRVKDIKKSIERLVEHTVKDMGHGLVEAEYGFDGKHSIRVKFNHLLFTIIIENVGGVMVDFGVMIPKPLEAVNSSLESKYLQIVAKFNNLLSEPNSKIINFLGKQIKEEYKLLKQIRYNEDLINKIEPIH